MPENAEFNLFILDPSLGVSEYTLENLAIYPNPTDAQITIETTNKINQIEIFNMLGQKIFSINGISNKMNVETSSLNTGTYLVKVTSDTASQIVKLLKV